MVATMKNAADVVIGTKDLVDAARLSVSDWVKILEAACSELTLDYLRNLQSLKQILNKEERAEDSDATSCSNELLGGVAIPSGIKLFLDCGQVTKRNRAFYNRYPDKEHRPHVSYAPPRTQVLLGRARAAPHPFFLLKSEWEYHRKERKSKWEQGGISVATKISLAQVSLEELLEGAGERMKNYGVRILLAMVSAQSWTAVDLERRSVEARKQAQTLEGYTKRLNCICQYDDLVESQYS